MASALDVWNDGLMARNETSSSSARNQRSSPTQFLQHLAGQVSHPGRASPWQGAHQLAIGTTTCLLEMAGRVSDHRDHPARGQHTSGRGRRASWCARTRSLPRRTHGGHIWLSPRAPARSCCAHRPVRGLRHQVLTPGCQHVSG